jgi:hypothetical protein
MNEHISKRFWKGVLLGGPMAAGMLFSLIAFVGMYGNEGQYEAWQLVTALTAFAVFLLGTLWATGFWGRWGMLAFFALAPVIVVADFAVNPYAPAGSILLAAGFLWATAGTSKGGASA